MHIEELQRDSRAFERLIAARKAECGPPGFPWYPYGTLSNFAHLNRLLSGANRALVPLDAGRPVADVGGADGDLAFFLESKGLASVDLVDYAPTNYNSLRGARMLKEQLGSKVEIHELDLDSYFRWPRDDYELVFFLGILYHLKNPYYVLESLAKVARYSLISTRVAQFGADRRTPIANQAVAYLLAPDECNNDATNFWIFSQKGLARILDRTGWTVLDHVCVGNTRNSDPASADGDERAFVFVKSRWRD
jgi:tRNA (mo5U34)-methyltransferase